MIRLGLRLATAGGREAITRLALIAIAVAIGAGLLLTTLAGINAVNTQNSRYAWLETGYTGSNAPAAPGSSSAARTSPLLWKLSADYFRGIELGRLDLATTGPNPPLPPGIARLPAPGQYYASPELARLIRDTPTSQLGDRFPGTLIGIIGKDALPAPNSLVIIIGRTAAELAREHDVVRVSSISTTVPSSCSGDCALGVGIDSNGIVLVLSVVTAALLFPVLIFIGGATRLSAARREQRFAAMRLIGATPGQIAIIASVESSVASIVGVAGGFGLFFVFRPVLATIPFTGSPFFTSDLSLSLADVLAVALGIPLAAAAVARLALRRVTISPLGVSRRVRSSPPRAWRVLPLLAGVAELGYLAYFSHISQSTNSMAQAYAYLAGIFLIMIGLVVIGPWLTMLGSRLMARRAQRPASLIAARRLADDPHAGFRAISGVVVAVFVGTCALGIISAIIAYSSGSTQTTAASAATVVDTYRSSPSQTSTSHVPSQVISRLQAIPGVTGVAVVRSQADTGLINAAPLTVARCAELAGIPALGRCRPGASFAAINPDFGGGVVGRAVGTDNVGPPVEMTNEEFTKLPINMVMVGTNGTTAAIEQARTILGPLYSDAYPPQTIGEMRISGQQQINNYRQLAKVVIIASMPIAGCSLAVSVVGGLVERKRPFSLLRLTGAPLAMLRRVITFESAVPLLLTAVLSAGAGLLAAQLFLRAQLHETLQPPGIQYYLLLIIGLAASVGVIASTMPMLNRITGPESARND